MSQQYLMQDKWPNKPYVATFEEHSFYTHRELSPFNSIIPMIEISKLSSGFWSLRKVHDINT